MKSNPYESPSPIVEHRKLEPRALLGVASLALALAASGVLLFVASHVRADRTHRRPVITWEGPAAAWAIQLAYAGWLLSGISAWLAARSMSGSHRQQLVNVAAILIAIVNFFGSLIFWAGVAED
jgi:hypothetical protein